MYKRDFKKYPVWNKDKKGLQIAWNKGLPTEMQPMFGKKFSEETKNKMRAKSFGRHVSVKTKKKISLKNNGRRHTKEAIEKIRKNNVKYWLGKKLSEKTRKKISEARMKQVLPLKDTSIEIKIQKELEKKQIDFSKHKEIYGLPDIFIKPNICIFCDGDYWHNRLGAKEHDIKVNETLRRKGYLIIRFWEHEINKSPEECVNKILNSI